jgi:hypothetical protein
MDSIISYGRALERAAYGLSSVVDRRTSLIARIVGASGILAPASARLFPILLIRFLDPSLSYKLNVQYLWLGVTDDRS